MKKQTKNSPQLRFPEFEAEWQLKEIKDVGQVVTGSTPSTSNTEYYGGNELFVSPADIYSNRYIITTKTTLSKAGFEKGRLIKKGSVLFVCIGSTIGKVGQAGFDCITNQQINSVISKIDNDNNFIYSLLEKKARHIKILAGEQAVPIINKSTFERYKLFLPTLPEQQKIASFLSAVDQKIQLLTRKKTLLEQYKKGAMQKIFSRTIRFKDENGQDYPDWEEKRLGEVASRVTTKNHDGEVKAVLTNSATDGIVNQQDYFKKDIANQENLQGYYVVSQNDFVYNPRISHHAPVGPIKRNKLDIGVMSPLYTVFRINQRYLNYFEYYFETTKWYRYMHCIANFGARHDRMNITNADFLKMPLPVPCDIEQEKICLFLDQLTRKIEIASIQLSQTQSFKKGLLQRMFV